MGRILFESDGGQKICAISDSSINYGGGVYRALVVLGVVRPDLGAPVAVYSPAELAAAEKQRDNSVDPADTLTIYRAVDYSRGIQAAWYPKGEAPILAELVAEGELPPVAERVGPEPVVYEGVEGIGRYGGTWVRALTDEGSLRFYMTYELGNTTLLRFSPHGYPATPLLAQSYEVSQDNAVFTFRLRKGMRWSDGHPFTADDIMFWWEGWATWKDPDTGEQLGWISEIVKARGKEGRIKARRNVLFAGCRQIRA